jgi:hypothetical protein
MKLSAFCSLHAGPLLDLFLWSTIQKLPGGPEKTMKVLRHGRLFFGWDLNPVLLHTRLECYPLHCEGGYFLFRCDEVRTSDLQVTLWHCCALKQDRQRSPITSAVYWCLNKYVCPALAVATLYLSGLRLVPPSWPLSAVTNHISCSCHLHRQFFCLWIFLFTSGISTLALSVLSPCNKGAPVHTVVGNYCSNTVNR